MTFPFCEMLAFLGAGVSSLEQARAREAREQAQMARAEAEIYHLVEDEFRFVLSECGRDAPMLRRVSLEFDQHDDAYLFHADFDGQPGQSDLVRHARWCAHDMRNVVAAFNGAPGSLAAGGFENECRRIYSRLYEDHLLELDLRVAREELDYVVERTTDRTRVDTAYTWYREYEAHITRHYRARAAHPPMFVYGEVSPDLQIYPGAVNYVDRVTAGMAIAPQPERPMTATEVRARQAQSERRWTHAWAQVAEALLPDPMVLFTGDWGLGADVGDPQAQQRGLDLLKANLTPEQLAQYEKDKHFIVVGSHTRKRYRIRHGRQMNIDELDDNGQRVSGLCFLPEGGLVAGDCMLAQKIALENSERDALKIANRFA